MAFYRSANIRLTKETSDNLKKTCYPGPDELINGKYARLRPQYLAFQAFDKAHIIMLCEQGWLSQKEAADMLAVLRELEEGDVEEARAATGEHWHAGEAILTQRLGKAKGGKMHLGRSSGDLLNVTYRYTLRQRLLALCGAFNEFRSAVLKVAEEHKNTVMPAYTHMQHAQPMTFGYYLASWAAAYDRDFERLRQFFARANVSPAGAAIIGGSEFQLDRARTCELLGFDKVSVNCFDSVWGRDVEIEAMSLITVLGGDIGRLAEDLLLWSTPEFRMVESDDALCGTSSIMPQKKNSYALEYLKGLPCFTSGACMEMAMVHKNPTSAPVLDWIRMMGDTWRCYDELITAIPLAEEVISTLKVNKELMRYRAGYYWATATDLAGVMVKECNIPWRQAHQITGITVRLGIERNLNPEEIGADLVREASRQFNGQDLEITDGQVRRAMNPEESVKNHNMPGGPAAERVAEELDVHKKILLDDRAWLEKQKIHNDNAAKLMESVIDRIIRPNE